MEKKTALCLGGGAVLGAAHIGVLKALEEIDFSIDCICGTSIGAIIGALYASGKNAQEIEKIALDIKWSDLYSISLSKYGILSNESVGDFLLEHIPTNDFQSLCIPFGVIATDISSGEKVILHQGDLTQAVMASSCIPGVFIPIEIEQRLLVDGGLVENVPISVAKKFGATSIIAVDLNGRHSPKKPQNILQVLLNSFEFLSNNSTQYQLKEADIILKPNLERFDPIDTDQIKLLIEEGYTYTKEFLKQQKGQ